MSDHSGAYEMGPRTPSSTAQRARRAVGGRRRPHARQGGRRDGVEPRTSGSAVLPPIEADLSGQLRGFDALPHMPQVLAQVQQSLRSGRADAGRIAKLVSADPGLTAQILRVVNSAYYSLRREIVDLRYAVAYLGFNEIHRIVLTVSVVQGLGVKDPSELKRFWHHSFYTALIAKCLAGIYERHIEPGELWPAALLHDVGVLVYMRLYPRHWNALAEHRAEEACLLVDAERDLRLPSHTTMGAALCERWQLPESIHDVCRHHELDDPSSEPGTPLNVAFRRMVSAASLLSQMSTGDLRPDVRERAGRHARRLLGLDQRDFMTLMGTIYELRHEADAFTAELA
ncbi:MAG: HDOD domain-containing protein [Myxococcota bacterium]